MKKSIIACLVVAALTLSGCSKSADWHTESGALWGTSYTIKYKAPRQLSAEIADAISLIDSTVNVFNPQSNVSLINECRTDTVHPATAEVFTEARRIARLSNGAFDPTVGPLVQIWGFGTDKSVSNPDSALIDSLLRTVGILDCELHGNRLAKKHPGTQFNFSAIAKGYGVDRVARALAEAGATDYMVEIGGEIVVAGNNPSGEPWNIQIDAPTSGATSHDAMTVLPLTNCAIATSGNYRNYRDLSDGTRVSHTISARTGRPVSTDVLSATVIAPRCITADALATALMAMPSDSASAIMGRLNRGDSVRIILVTPDRTIFLP